MSGRTGQLGHAAHESTADSEDMNVHENVHARIKNAGTSEHAPNPALPHCTLRLPETAAESRRHAHSPL